MTNDSYDVEYVCRIIEQKMGRPANEAERRAVAKIGNARDRRRLGQLIQNSSDDVDITRIELPPLPESAKDSQVVDEELDPVAWRHIANLCSKPGTIARPAIPEGGMQPASDFRSVPQQRGQLHAEQQQRHQRISNIAAERKQKRMEEAQRRSAPMKTTPTGAAEPPAQITAE